MSDTATSRKSALMRKWAAANAYIREVDLLRTLQAAGKATKHDLAAVVYAGGEYDQAARAAG